jgi:hypothetical protein
MTIFHISSDQFDSLDLDMPDRQLIVEALQDVIDDVNFEEIWTHKGNYQLAFWSEKNKPYKIFSNARVLLNPDDPNDSNTKPYCYYFEIEVVK